MEHTGLEVRWLSGIPFVFHPFLELAMVQGCGDNCSQSRLGWGETDRQTSEQCHRHNDGAQREQGERSIQNKVNTPGHKGVATVFMANLVVSISQA